MSRVVKKTIKDDNLSEMFNQMLGGDGDPEIIAGKFIKLKAALKIVANLLNEFGTGPFFKQFEYKEWEEQICSFANQTKEIGEKKEIVYKDLKEHNHLKHVVMICKDLLPYRKQIEEQTDGWVLDHPGVEYKIFNFTSLDVKMIWVNPNMSKRWKSYILMILKILMTKCYEIYNIVTSPDIDVKQFSEIIVSSIDKVKELPQLNRCKLAFQKIIDSVGMLETNFNGYYRDMVQSQNPSTIIESFIVDVAKGQEMNPQLMMQFRTIVGFYREQSKGKTKDPAVKKLFATLEEKMKMFGSL